MNLQFFYRIFRNFGPVCWPLIEGHLDKLIASKKEGEQRLASEIVSGVLLASKLWTYDRVSPMVQWLRPRLLKCFENMTDLAESNWCTSIANVFSRTDIRQCFWLYDLLTHLLLTSTDNGFHTTFRLRVLHSCVVQYEWRVPHLLRDLFRYCSTLIARNSQFLRGRVGAALASCVLHDVHGMYRDPNVKEVYHPLKIDDLIAMINREIRDEVWPLVLHGGFDELQHIWSTPYVDTLPRLPYEKPTIPPMEAVTRSTSVEPDPMEEETSITAAATGAGASTTPAHSPGVKSDSKVDRKLSATSVKAPGRITRTLKRTSTPPLSTSKVGIIAETGRKREKAIGITLSNSMYSCWSLASPGQLFTAFELIPLLAYYANDKQNLLTVFNFFGV